MIGRRDYKWLMRGLASATPSSSAQNYQCTLDQGDSGPPTLTDLRLCEAGDRPWGCP